MVVFATPEQSSQVFALGEAFEESNLPFRVDLFVWDDVPERFRKHIEQDYVVLKKKERSTESGWKTVTLGEFVPFTYGKGLPVGKRNSSGAIPVFGANGIVGYHNSPLTDGPTIIIGRKGTVGAVHYSPIPCWPIDTTFFITGNDSTLVRFKYYALSVLGLERMNSDSAVPGLNRSAAHARTLLLPGESEQRSIAHILGTLDDKIELNRRMNETLEEMARAIFKDWFVDFGPTRAKMEGRDTGLPAEVAALFPDRLVESELGEMPEGWGVETVEDITKIVGGTTPSTKQPRYWEGGTHCWATPKDLSALSTHVLLETERKITDAGLNKIGSGLLPSGTVLLSSRAPIGYLAVAEVPVAVNQGFIAILPREHISNLFLLYWCETSHDEIISHANGSTFLEISKGNFRPLPLVVPDTGAMSAFDRLTRPLYERVVSNERESRTLAALRDALLPKLVSGEMKVG